MTTKWTILVLAVALAATSLVVNGCEDNQRIYAAEKAASNEFAFVAKIAKKEDNSIYCLGVFVIRSFVLTNNCEGLDYRRDWIVLGGCTSRSDCSKHYEIRKFLPYYNEGPGRLMQLVQLEDDINFNETKGVVDPIPFDYQLDLKPGASATLIGWPKSEHGDQSDALMKMNVDIVEGEYCRRAGLADNLVEQSYCTHSADKWPCFSVPGAPLVTSYEGKQVLAGFHDGDKCTSNKALYRHAKWSFFAYWMLDNMVVLAGNKYYEKCRMPGANCTKTRQGPDGQSDDYSPYGQGDYEYGDQF